jgi:hypothetical protein
MEVFAELDCKMVAKRLRDGHLAKAAAGRKAVGDYLFGCAATGKGLARDVGSGRPRPSRRRWLASSNCVALGAPTVRSPQPSTHKGTSPAEPPPGRLQPCAKSPCGRFAVRNGALRAMDDVTPSSDRNRRHPA